VVLGGWIGGGGGRECWPPAPCGVQAAARREPDSTAAGRRRHLETAGRESRDVCHRTNLGSPRGCGAIMERSLDDELQRRGSRPLSGVVTDRLGPERCASSNTPPG